MVIEILSGVVVPLIGIFTNKEWKRWKRNKKVNQFRKSIEINSQINIILAEIRAKYGFNRVSILDYHNGTESLSGFSFKYSTMSYENTDNHTKDIITEFKNIPCSIVNNMLVDLEHNPKGYVIDGIKNCPESIAITHKMFGVDTAYNFRLGGSLIDGCLSCVYTHETTFQNILNEEEILDIKSLCQKIYLIRRNK